MAHLIQSLPIYSGLVNGDTDDVFSGALEREPGELANSYDINQGTLSAGSNYTISGHYVVGGLNIEDTVAPTVVSHTPSSGAFNISPLTSIIVTFSEAVNIDEAEGYIVFNPAIHGGFKVTNSGTNVITITPKKPLANDTTYTMTINDIEDTNGTPFTTYDIEFTTAPVPPPNSGGGGGVPIIISNTPRQRADINKDNKIDILDFNTLMVNWGNVIVNNVADFNSDGKVDVFDFNLLMINWTL